MKPKVIVSDKINKECKEIIESLNDVAQAKFTSFSNTKEFLGELEDAAGLLVVLEPVNEELLRFAPKLKIVARYGVGYDTVDVEACTKRGIYVTHTPSVLSHAAAEFTIGLIICVSKGIVLADHYVRTEWAKADKTQLHMGVDLIGKVLGIIGLGRIGYEVALRAKAFGMKLVYYDEIRKPEAEKELNIQYMNLNDLLKTSDFVTIHVPLTAKTQSFIGEKELRLMKHSAYLVNTSRGPVVDETALCKALKESWIAGAGLDVFMKEPLPFENPLIKMKNVVLTPHMATYTIETRRAIASVCVENIRKVLLGEVPPNPVPEQKGKNLKNKLSF
ncbi:MAG: D-glycerate dehydrogenase [Candidatus Bathyarchaeia archaeon]